MSGINSELHTTIKQAEADLDRFETRVVTAIVVTVPLAIAGYSALLECFSSHNPDSSLMERGV